MNKTHDTFGCFPDQGEAQERLGLIRRTISIPTGERLERLKGRPWGEDGVILSFGSLEAGVSRWLGGEANESPRKGRTEEGVGSKENVITEY